MANYLEIEDMHEPLSLEQQHEIESRIGRDLADNEINKINEFMADRGLSLSNVTWTESAPFDYIIEIFELKTCARAAALQAYGNSSTYID